MTGLDAASAIEAGQVGAEIETLTSLEAAFSGAITAQAPITGLQIIFAQGSGAANIAASAPLSAATSVALMQAVNAAIATVLANDAAFLATQ